MNRRVLRFFIIIVLFLACQNAMACYDATPDICDFRGVVSFAQQPPQGHVSFYAGVAGYDPDTGEQVVSEFEYVQGVIAGTSLWPIGIFSLSYHFDPNLIYEYSYGCDSIDYSRENCGVFRNYYFTGRVNNSGDPDLPDFATSPPKFLSGRYGISERGVVLGDDHSDTFLTMQHGITGKRFYRELVLLTMKCFTRLMMISILGSLFNV